MYRFVKAKGDEEIERIKPTETQIANSKISARELYEDVLRMPSISSRKQNARTPVPEAKLRSRTSDRRIATFDKVNFFKAAQSNDIQTLKKMYLNSLNVNLTDEFGWTALMMVSYEGHLDIVKLLIRSGAKIEFEDRQKNTAVTLATKKDHSNVVTFLEKTLELRKSKTVNLSSDEDEALKEEQSNQIHCDECRINFEKSKEKEHLSSTLHRFNQTKSHKFTRHFGIPESNVGFRMMLRQGWNRDSGLGPEQNGVMYPIKTTLRKSRSGLGTRQPCTAKVTHFKAFDRNAIKADRAPPVQIITAKKQIKSDKMKTQRKDRYLRKLLS